MTLSDFAKSLMIFTLVILRKKTSEFVLNFYAQIGYVNCDNIKLEKKYMKNLLPSDKFLQKHTFVQSGGGSKTHKALCLRLLPL